MLNLKNSIGFTLIEVAISIAILAAGSTACISMFITGIRWTTETKVNASAPITAQAVMDTPKIFAGDPRNTPPFKYTVDSQGWINNYFAQRIVSDLEEVRDRNGKPSGGYICTVDVRIFMGGDDKDGELVYTLKKLVHFRDE